ncbi:MAG: CHAT domain-containing protein [Pirellulales bacterium]
MNSVPPLRDVLSSSDKVRFLQRDRLENETAINVRWKAWSSFQSVSDEASQANDERRVTAWREELFSGWNLAEAERGKLQASLDRLQLLARLRQTIDSLGSPPRLDGERQIIALAAPLGDYVSDVTARVQQAQVRIHAFERFHNAIRAVHSEAAIVQAWIELQRAEGETLADPAQQHRAALAQERLRLLQHLQQLPHSLPPDQLDRHLLAIWHPLLEECLEARPWNVAYQTAMRRSRVLQQIRAAYERNDDAAQAELIRDPAMSGYSWPPEIAQSASAALDRIARGQKLMASVETGDRAAFRERFDQRLLCQSAAQFAPYRDLLKRWIVEEILPCRKMGLDLPIGTSAVAQQRSPPNSYVARWRWPNSRFTDTCVLAICKQLPKDGKHPQSLDIHEQLNVPRHIYEARGGHVVHSLPAWAGSYIVVWALVETGWETLTSEPLVLGRLPGASWTMVTARAKWYRPILNWFRQITLSTDSTVHPDQRQCKEREDLPPRNDGNEGERPECPNCGSARMRLEADEAAWICDACGFHWNPATSAPPPPVLQRHTDVSFPQEVPVQKTTTLRIQFVPAEETTPEGQVVALPKPHAHDVTLPFHVPKPVQPHQPPPPIRVHICVVAENFAVEGSSEAEVVVPLLGRSAPVPFRLQGLCVGPGRIVVDFDQSGRHVGSVELRPDIVAADAQPASDQAPTQGEVRPVAQPGPAPDAVIKVFEFRLAGQPGRLHFVFSSADPRLKDLSIAMEGDLGTVDLRSEVAPWVEGQLKRIGEVARRSDVAIDEVQRKLRDVGHDLFDQLLPPGLKELTWTLQQRGIRRVLVLSDEPHIPWELIKPYRKNAFTSQFEDEAPFWGESYALTRWLRGRVPPDHLRLQRAVTVTATGSNLPETAIRTTRDLVPEEGADGCASEPAAMDSEDALLSTDEERAVSHCLTSSGVRVRSLHPRKRSLEQLFAAADFDLLHLVSHGAFGGATAADASALMMEDGPFQAIDLSPSMEAALRAAAPLVFFNACHSGRIGLSLTRLGSWGARLVQLGCGGFVGALWPVTDEAAPIFANSFYESLIAGKSIAEAVQIARHKTRERFPADPTWLAYCCYADPMATVASDR